MVQTIRLDQIIEEINSEPDIFRKGRNLTPDQKRVIREEDTWEVSLVCDMPEEVVKILSRAFLRLDEVDYKRRQKQEWFETQRALLRGKLGREPTSLEMIDDAERNHNYTHYNLCYILNNPTKVAINLEHYEHDDACQEAVAAFLASASKLHPERLDYFTIIEKNTIAYHNPR